MRADPNTELHHVDRIMLATVVALLALSILMVFSTTAVSSQQLHGDSAFLIKKHLFSIALGIGGLFFMFNLRLDVLRKIAPWVLFAEVFILIFVLSGLGHSAGGAQRWFSIGPMRVQPGELAKFSMALYMATYIGRQHLRMQYFVPGIVMPFGLLAMMAVLLLLQPDFGTTVVISVVVFSQLLTVSRFSHLVGLALSGVAMLAVLIYSSPYRMRRLISFVDPFKDASDSGYQLIQSLIAVGSGGLTGRGLGGGIQKLNYLPAAHTDFIFAVIAEELGLVGAVAVILLFVLFAYRGFYHCWRLRHSPFLCSLALGCTLIIIVPATLNMGVVTGLLPTKGLVLPLIAYGGTAMISHLAVLGVLLRLTVTRAEEAPL